MRLGSPGTAAATALLSATFLIALPPALGQSAALPATVRGKVVDFKTGEALDKAMVSIRDQNIGSTTGHDGTFELRNVAPGSVELTVSTVGYGLLKTRIDVAAGAVLELDLLLGQDALKHSEHVTVTAGPYAPLVPDAPTQYSLSGTETRELSTVLADDPLRAVHNLPGVSANQDYYADFAVRGAGQDHIGVFFDGVLVDRPFHAVRDDGDIGSLSILNGDLIEATTLMSGAFPASYGDRTGAVLDVQTRDGARDRIQTRASAGFLGASVTSEGPLGKSRKASWLVSFRKSYLEYLMNRLNVSDGLSLGYEDVEGKLTYGLTEHHKLALTAFWGGDQVVRAVPDVFGQEDNYFTHGHSRGDLASLRWSWIASPATLLQTQVSWNDDAERDRNGKSQTIIDTDSRQYAFRSDVTRQFGNWNRFEAGVSDRRIDERYLEMSLWNFAAWAIEPYLIPLANFAGFAWQPGGYAEDSIDLLHHRVTLQAGGRWDKFSVTRQSVLLPHASITWAPTALTRLSISAGQYAQFPGFQNLCGEFGTPGLRATRATHEVVSLDRFLAGKLRLHAEAYNRQERQVIYSPETQFRLFPWGGLDFPQPGPVLQNALQGYSRGVEIAVQRRSANRFSGWVSYSRSYNKYWQPGTDLSFWGDFDQRNTVTAYGSSRLTSRLSVSASARYGSGYPLAGFLDGPLNLNLGPSGLVAFQLTELPNRTRLPAYQRVDCRTSYLQPLMPPVSDLPWAIRDALNFGPAPLVADVFFQEERGKLRGIAWWRFGPIVLYAASAAALALTVIAPFCVPGWRGLRMWSYPSCTAILGVSSAITALLIWRTRHSGDPEVKRKLARWVVAGFGLLGGVHLAQLFCNPMWLSAIESLVPGALLFVLAYYVQPLTFDVLIKEVPFSYFVLVAVYLSWWEFPGIPFLGGRNAFPWFVLCVWPAIAAVPWLRTKWLRWIDATLFQRRFTPAEARTMFLAGLEGAITEEELARSALSQIFGSAARISLPAAAPSADRAGMHAAIRAGGEVCGSFQVASRARIPRFMGADIALPNSLASEFSILLDNQRLREKKIEQERREKDLQILATRAELKALRAQINPISSSTPSAPLPG